MVARVVRTTLWGTWWRGFHRALMVIGISVAIVNACGFLRGPQITCGDVSTVDCQHALDMAQPLLSSYWGKASEVFVHPGICARFMRCLANAERDQSHVLVELTVGEGLGLVPFVVIDRQDATWKATCSVFVYSGNTGSTEACQGS